MASFSASFLDSASSTGASIQNAIQSYRRAQYLVVGSTVAASVPSELEADEAESQIIPVRDYFEDQYDSDEERQGQVITPGRTRDDFTAGNLVWDEDYETTTTTTTHFAHRRNSWLGGRRPIQPRPSYEQGIVPARLLRQKLGPTPRETTPLLKKTLSRRSSVLSGSSVLVPPSFEAGGSGPLQRRLSSNSVKDVVHSFGGQSTYGQTLFNSIAILLGIGMLSEPLAFAYSGWFAGTTLIISYGFISCYTAKILARVVLSDPRIRSYSDIGRKAFGPRVTPLINLMFCMELFAVCVILVTLYGDSLHTIFPQYSSGTYKVWGTLLLIPTVFLPLSLLSYTSLLGITSTVLMVLVILIDGLSKTDAPGSLWTPAPTDFGVKDLNKLGIAFGLFMAGFSGHAVIPSLARDMMDPSQFDHMINWAFFVATCIYTMIGYAGYMMFGNNVSDEISMDLLNTPGYNVLLNNICLWLLVLSPLSKFALNTQPLNTTISIMLGISEPLVTPEELTAKPNELSVMPGGLSCNLRKTLGAAQRILLTVLIVATSIMVPEFSSMMAFLGSFSAFMLSIVGPILVKLVLEKTWGILDGIGLVGGVVMAIWGTLAAFLPSE